MANSRENEDPIIPSFFYLKPNAPEQYRGKFVLGISFDDTGGWEAERASGDGPSAQGIRLNFPIVIPDISEQAVQEIMSALEAEQKHQNLRGSSLDKQYAIFALQDLEWLR